MKKIISVIQIKFFSDSDISDFQLVAQVYF